MRALLHDKCSCRHFDEIYVRCRKALFRHEIARDMLKDGQQRRGTIQGNGHLNGPSRLKRYKAYKLRTNRGHNLTITTNMPKKFECRGKRDQRTGGPTFFTNNNYTTQRMTNKMFCRISYTETYTSFL